MAEQHGPSAHAAELDVHRHTFRGFVRGGVAIVIHVFYVLVALVSVRFATTLPVLLAFLGILVGIIFPIIDLRAGSRNFLLSLGGLVVFALITAINIS
jgi:hypothetical protein